MPPFLLIHYNPTGIYWASLDQAVFWMLGTQRWIWTWILPPEAHRVVGGNREKLPTWVNWFQGSLDKGHPQPVIQRKKRLGQFGEVMTSHRTVNVYSHWSLLSLLSISEVRNTIIIEMPHFCLYSAPVTCCRETSQPTRWVPFLYTLIYS